jgi:hypothetical protein
MERADATSFSRNNLGIGRNELPEQVNIFVVDIGNIVNTKMTIFFFSTDSFLIFFVIHNSY